jgi:hypothetical protein
MPLVVTQFSWDKSVIHGQQATTLNSAESSISSVRSKPVLLRRVHKHLDRKKVEMAPFGLTLRNVPIIDH